MDVTPDYDKYSLDDLYSAADSIDREQYPERAALIQQHITEREARQTAELQTQQQLAALQPEPRVAAAPEVPANLAKRSHRFWGAIIDGVLQILISIPLFWYVGLAAFADPSLGLIIGSFLYGVAAYIVLHGYLLHRYGQTIGKAEFGMRIEHLDGRQVDLKHVLLLRHLPMMGLTFIPVIGNLIAGLVNPLMIFGKQKRCLHDRIAQTRVCYISDKQQQQQSMTA